MTRLPRRQPRHNIGPTMEATSPGDVGATLQPRQHVGPTSGATYGTQHPSQHVRPIKMGPSHVNSHLSMWVQPRHHVGPGQVSLWVQSCQHVRSSHVISLGPTCHISKWDPHPIFFVGNVTIY